MGAPTPKADFCWEGRLACVIFLLWTLYFFTALRFKALRGTKYSVFSPRGIAGVFIITAVVFCTVYTVLFIWNYSVWFDIRRMSGLAKTSREDEMIPIVREMIPGNRKAVAFAMRMLLVTVLWLVKMSFLVIYYEFPEILPFKTRMLLHTTTAFVVLSYCGIWIATAMEWSEAINREAFSPNAGAGITLFFPLNSWSTYESAENWVTTTGFPAILRAEMVITTLNAGTDILLLVLVYAIFRHLNLSSGRTQFRAATLLCTLFIFSVVIALTRLIILVVSMHGIYARLAFDSLTDFEAFLSGCAASIPAIRVLVRDYTGSHSSTITTRVTAGDKDTPPPSPSSVKPVAAFPEKWGKFSWGLRRPTEESGYWDTSTYASVRSTSGQSWARRMEEAREDSARAERLAPIGHVEVKITGGTQGGEQTGWQDVPWEELAEKGVR